MSDANVKYWDGLAVAVAQDRALLGPEACALLLRVMDAYRRVEHAPLSAQAAHVRSVLAVIGSQAGIGHSDVRSEPDPASSETWIPTLEIAARLEIVQRHAYRLARSGAFGETRKVKGRWLVRQDELEAYIAMKEEPA